MGRRPRPARDSSPPDCPRSCRYAAAGAVIAKRSTVVGSPPRNVGSLSLPGTRLERGGDKRRGPLVFRDATAELAVTRAWPDRPRPDQVAAAGGVRRRIVRPEPDYSFAHNRLSFAHN